MSGHHQSYLDCFRGRVLVREQEMKATTILVSALVLMAATAAHAKTDGEFKAKSGEYPEMRQRGWMGVSPKEDIRLMYGACLSACAGQGMSMSHCRNKCHDDVGSVVG